MNWYSNICILTYLTLSIFKIIEINADVIGCIRLNKPKNNENEVYSSLLRPLKQKLTSALEDDNSTKYYEHLEFDFKHPAVSAKGELNKVYIRNLNDFTLKYFQNIDIIHNKMELFNLTFHNMSITGEYDLTGNIGDLFDIFGDGDFWLNQLNFSISAMSGFPAINQTAACITMDIRPRIEKVEGWFKDLMNDEELEEVINNTIMKLIPEVVDVLWSEFKDDLDEAIQKLVDSIINGDSSHILRKFEELQENANQKIRV